MTRRKKGPGGPGRRGWLVNAPKPRPSKTLGVPPVRLIDHVHNVLHKRLAGLVIVDVAPEERSQAGAPHNVAQGHITSFAGFLADRLSVVSGRDRHMSVGMICPDAANSLSCSSSNGPHLVLPSRVMYHLEGIGPPVPNDRDHRAADK